MATGSTDEGGTAGGPSVRVDEAAGRWVLVATILGSGMTMLDSTVVNVALPRLGDDLGSDFAGLQWVVNGYMLALASLILLGGSLGDRLGRRRVFTAGAVAFTAASLLCAVAPSVEALVAARVLQGVGGALLTPGSLAIIHATIHPDDRGRAIGTWSGLGGITTAIGPFLGGWIVDVASWRWIFLINLPLGALVTYVAVTRLPETRDAEASTHLDLAGAALGAGGLAVLTWGLIEARTAGVAAGLVLLALFVAVERRTTDPMLVVSIFRSRAFSATNGATLFIYGALGASMFMIALVLQRAMGYSPLEAGAATVPVTLVLLVASPWAGALAQRIGPRLPMTVGPLGIAAGLVLMRRIAPGAGYAEAVLPAVLGLAAGLALTVAPLTATALATAPDRHAGLASGVNNAVARTGQLLAVAVIPLVAGFAPGVEVAPDELVVGFHTVSTVVAAGVVVAAAFAWAFVPVDALDPGRPTGPSGSAAAERHVVDDE
ncbi:MFS transporter [Actinomarinicola tropica]|uniref:MFS transporter n=1 Tax=Actinomarinicola tropica TaxID=2789776 RepID=UPI001E43E957|nr:MFS transporter [Actinomarinicola tropica]